MTPGGAFLLPVRWLSFCINSHFSHSHTTTATPPLALMVHSLFDGLVSVLRIHRLHEDKSSSTDQAIGRLVQAVTQTSSWSRVIVAVSLVLVTPSRSLLNVRSQQYDAADSALEHALLTRPELVRCREQQVLEFLPAQPWSCSLPLNASIIRARKMGASKIVFMSVEMTVLAEEVGQMLNLWAKGARFPVRCAMALISSSPRNAGDREGARPPPIRQGRRRARGAHGADHAVEHLRDLGSAEARQGRPFHFRAVACVIVCLLSPFFRKTGFLLVSDTNVAPGQSAIEEVPTIALHQLLAPHDSEATLLKFPDADPATAGWDTTWCASIHLFPDVAHADPHRQD